jgi:hypothetical protein
MVEKLEDDMKSGGVDKHSLDSQQQEVLDHLLERLTVMKKALTSGDSEEEDDVDYEERTYSHYGKHKSHTEDSSDEGNSSDEPLVDSPEHSSEDSNSKHSSEEDSPCAETKETLLAIEGELKKLHSGHHSDDHSHSHSHHNSHHGSHHGHSQDNDEAEEDDGVDAEIEEERKELEEMTDKLDPDHKTSDHSRETDLSSMSHDTFEDRVSHGDTNIGDSDDSSKEASEEEARLVEQVALQSAKVARISNELKAAEGNGKRTIEDVQKDLKEKNAQAEEAHQELKAQHGIFEQVKQQREEIGNSTAKQRQVAADAEAKHMAAKAAFEQEKRKLEQLQRQKEDADKAVTKAEVTRTETQEKVHVDTSELREHVSKLDELNAELKAVQEKERLEAVPPKRPVTAIDAEDPDEGFISKVLHSIGL